MSQEKPPPPQGRQIVVLREGPPAHRTAVVDGIVGAAGVALLVLAGVLGEVLPEEEVMPRQYLPEFPLNNTQATIRYVDGDGRQHMAPSIRFTGGSENAPIPGEGSIHDIDILVQHDNVISFKVNVVIPGDDVASSLQDSFKFQLFDPEGEPIEDHWRVTTEAPQEVPPDLANGSFEVYVSPLVSDPKLQRFRSQPEAEFISSGDPSFSREEALLVASERYTLPSRGTVWTLRMEMSNAGDCEPASPDPDVVKRRVHCLSRTDGEGEDRGNPITISEVLYDYYLIEVPE